MAIGSLIERFQNISWQDLKKYSWVLPVFFTLLLSKVVADLVVLSIDYSLTPVQTKVQIKPQINLLPPNIALISQFDVFYPSLKPEGAFDIANATKTRLPITLVGTVVFDDENKSFADVLLSNDKEITTIKKRDTVLNNQAKIHKIEYDRVYLVNLNTSGFEYVEIPYDQELPAFSSTPKDTSKPLSSESSDISRNRLKDALSKENIAKTITDAASRFEVAGGRIIGVRILSVRPGSLYEDLDIRKDDVLTMVNGQKVDNFKAATQLFEELKKNVDRISEPITITVIRNGKPEQKTYTIK